MNNIHGTAIITGDVILGQGNEIGPYSVLQGPLRLGDNNIIGSHVTIGAPGQDTRNPRYDSSNCQIDIGNNNIIREYTSIQKPCYRDLTSVGNNVYIMQGVHVPHDALIGDDVVLTPMVAMGGIVRLCRGANIALGAVISQYAVIGHYAIVGMGSAVVKNIRPFTKYVPGKPASVNTYAVKKFGFESYEEEIAMYVIHNIAPVSQLLAEIVAEFDALSLQSGRESY
jgi:UDP-N-acetylglucosamine acyltransferase